MRASGEWVGLVSERMSGWVSERMSGLARSKKTTSCTTIPYFPLLMFYN